MTLKEQYEKRRIKNLQERIKFVNARMLKENYAAELIVEAMDKADLDKAAQIIDKLKKMTGKGLKTLDNAINTAIGEINKYTGGGPIANAWTAIKSKVGIDNPLVKMMTFANSLETGFEQVPIIIKNNVGEVSKDNIEKNLMYVIGKQEPGVEDTVQKNLVKAFRPKGIFGSFRKVPYVENMDDFVWDLMNAPLKNLNAVVQQSGQGTSSDEIAKDLKDVASQAGDAETKGTQPAEPAEPAAKTSQTTSGKETTKTSPATAAGETPTKIPRERLVSASDALQKQFNISKRQANKIVNALNNLGMIK